MIAQPASLSYTVKFALRVFAKDAAEYAAMLDILTGEKSARQAERETGRGTSTLLRKVQAFKSVARCAADDLLDEYQLPTPGPTREGWEDDDVEI